MIMMFRPAGRLARALLMSAALAMPGAFPRAAAAQETLVPAVQPAPTAPVPADRVAVPADQPWLNGLSAIHTRDGQRFTALSNFGYVVEGRILRDRAGRLAGLQVEAARPLTFPDGRALTNGYRAAEGLAVGPGGRLFVSFEYHTRVWTYRTPAATPEDLGQHRDFERLPNGRGLASLALSPQGALYAIPERPARMTHGFPSYRWDDGEWIGSFRMPADGPFLPVGADFGPDGRLYVLEQAGGQSQIRRFAVQGDRMGGADVVVRSARGQWGYLSGLSVWRGRDGRLRATMVADNGGMAGRAAELVEVVLPR